MLLIWQNKLSLFSDCTWPLVTYMYFFFCVLMMELFFFCILLFCFTTDDVLNVDLSYICCIYFLCVFVCFCLQINCELKQVCPLLLKEQKNVCFHATQFIIIDYRVSWMCLSRCVFFTSDCLFGCSAAHVF